jgi:hypothetical protein
MAASSLYLYSTAGCHLCEQAEALLQPFSRAGRFHVQVVEISHDDELVQRYGLRIPVLACIGEKGRDELGWPFDQAQVWSWSSQAILMCQGS